MAGVLRLSEVGETADPRGLLLELRGLASSGIEVEQIKSRPSPEHMSGAAVEAISVIFSGVGTAAIVALTQTLMRRARGRTPETTIIIEGKCGTKVHLSGSSIRNGVVIDVQDLPPNSPENPDSAADAEGVSDLILAMIEPADS